MTIPPINEVPWVTVIGTPAVGPPGPQGPVGPQGPAGSPADQTAAYLLDTPNGNLVNSFAIHRALGPDRVPAVPSIQDDEFTNVGTGYDDSPGTVAWTFVNSTAGTVHADPFGGLVFDHDDGSRFITMSRGGFSGGSQIITAKVKLGTDAGARSSYIGIKVYVPGDNTGADTYWRFFGIGYTDGTPNFVVFDGFGDVDLSGITSTLYSSALGGPQYRPAGWWYLRVDSGHIFSISEDGISYQKLNASALPGAWGVPGLASYYHGTVPAKNYVQFFRVT